MTSYLIGVEWYTSVVRLACFRKTGSSVQLLRLERIEFSPEDTKPKEEILRDWIQNFLPARANVRVVLTVPESQVFLKELDVPKLKPNEIKEAIRWELFSRSSTFPEQSIITWQVLSENEHMLHVSALVMKERDSSDFVSLFAKAGLRLQAIEPHAVSSARLLKIPNKTSILLTLEGSDANIIFLKKQIPVFSTSITLPQLSQGEQKRHISRNTLSTLLSHVKQTIRYWEKKENEKVESILLTADAAGHTGIIDNLKRTTRIPVTVASCKLSPWSNPFKYGTSSYAVFALAIGAAMRMSPRFGHTDINLLPVDELHKIHREERDTLIVDSLIRFTKLNLLFAVVLLCFYGFLFFQQIAYAREIAQTKRFVTNHPGQQYVAKIVSANALLAQINQLTTAQKDPNDFLEYIASVTPPKLQYSTLKAANATTEEWTIEGVGSRSDILAFYYKIQSDKKAKDVSMPYSNLQKAEDAEFKITIIW